MSYYSKHKQEAKEYYKKNRKRIREIQHEYREKNKKKISEYNKKYQKQRYRNNIGYYKEYHKNKPHIMLENNKKQLEKLSLTIGMKSKPYNLAILSWSKTVKLRDNHKCQVCGGLGQISHHILHKAKLPELSLNLNNGITLCKWCHYEVHGFKF